MNAETLFSKIVAFRQTGSGQYRVTIEYRGKIYSGVTNNTMAIDRIHDDRDRIPQDFYVTAKQAARSLYNEVKRQNNLR